MTLLAGEALKTKHLVVVVMANASRMPRFSLSALLFHLVVYSVHEIQEKSLLEIKMDSASLFFPRGCHFEGIVITMVHEMVS
jgi:hypothetical protein